MTVATLHRRPRDLHIGNTRDFDSTCARHSGFVRVQIRRHRHHHGEEQGQHQQQQRRSRPCIPCTTTRPTHACAGDNGGSGRDLSQVPTGKKVKGSPHSLTRPPSKRKKGRESHAKGRETPRRGDVAGGDGGGRFNVFRDEYNSSVSLDTAADIESETVGGGSSTKAVTSASSAGENPRVAGLRIALMPVERHADRETDASTWALSAHWENCDRLKTR